MPPLSPDVLKLLLCRLKKYDISLINRYREEIIYRPSTRNLYRYFCYRDNGDETIRVGISMKHPKEKFDGILVYDPITLIKNAYTIDYYLRELHMELDYVLWNIQKIIYCSRCEDSSYFTNNVMEYSLFPNKFGIKISEFEYLIPLVTMVTITPENIFDCLDNWDIAGENDFTRAYNYFLLSYGMHAHSGIKREINNLFSDHIF